MREKIYKYNKQTFNFYFTMRKFNYFDASVNNESAETQVNNNGEQQCSGGFFARNKKPLMATAAAFTATIAVVGLYKITDYIKAKVAAKKAAKNAEETPANDAAKK